MQRQVLPGRMRLAASRRVGLRVAVVVGLVCLLAGCRGDGIARPGPGAMSVRESLPAPAAVISGTRIEVALATELSSETAAVGDSWVGRVATDVAMLNGGQIPAGSPVDGVVAVATPAGAGAEAVLQLGVRSITVNGRDEFIAASSESVQVALPAPGALAVLRSWTSGGVGSSRARRSRAQSSAGRVYGSARERVLLADGTVLSFRVRQTVALR